MQIPYKYQNLFSIAIVGRLPRIDNTSYQQSRKLNYGADRPVTIPQNNHKTEMTFKLFRKC